MESISADIESFVARVNKAEQELNEATEKGMSEEYRIALMNNLTVLLSNLAELRKEKNRLSDQTQGSAPHPTGAIGRGGSAGKNIFML